MGEIKDLTGKKFGKLTVVGFAYKIKTGEKGSGTYWKCKCDCGNEEIIIVKGSYLQCGHTKSCGCLKALRISNMVNARKQVKNDNEKARVGECNINKYGNKMRIIAYENNANVTVQFENGYKTKSTYKSFKDGSLGSPYDKTLFGIGYMGEGEYRFYEMLGTKATKQYEIWHGIIKRCNDPKVFNKQPTYKGCSVCEEWLNFQKFAKWYDENYYEVEGQQMHIDKDILFKGNKIYSPETCVFAPQNINCLFTKSNAIRGKYPIGVYFRKDSNKYVSQCNDGNKTQVYLGRYNTPEEAFNAYKIYKEKLIKCIADNYKNQIPQKLYNALYKYEVEITD